MRDPHLNTTETVQPFCFEKFGQMWIADFMHGPKLWLGKKKRKSYHFKQAGRGGTGTVLRDKKVRAMVAKFSNMKYDINQPADFQKLKEGGKAYSQEIRELDPQQNEMAVVGTAHLVPIMNDHDLLPVHNFRYGNHPDADKIGKEAYRQRFDPGFVKWVWSFPRRHRPLVLAAIERHRNRFDLITLTRPGEVSAFLAGLGAPPESDASRS